MAGDVDGDEVGTVPIIGQTKAVVPALRKERRDGVEVQRLPLFRVQVVIVHGGGIMPGFPILSSGHHFCGSVPGFGSNWRPRPPGFGRRWSYFPMIISIGMPSG